ncbi:hypothetical protein ACGFK1_15530 [Mycobacterium sp. NPDC048908]|uniref:hypothetical protein n=1 Tax=Mycobacterium sp. NPDC048908 TaxID=3364292 RepID=UPI003714C402
MKARKPASVRGGDEARRAGRGATRRQADAPPRRRKPTREQRPQRSAPATNPIPRPTDAPARPKTASQAKARAKARKAKAPKVIRPPLRERIVVRLASIDLNPRTLVARVPFVVLVIGSLGVGLGVTLWLSTDAAERSYQLSHARETNQALLQQKEALERQVLEAQAAPALAEAARNLGMIPSRDTAHLVQDPSGNWVVVGTPKPAQGVAPPPLNTPLPDEKPAPPPAPPAARVVEPRELTIRMPPRTQLPAPLPGVEQPVPVAGAAPLATPPGAEVPHAVPGQTPALGPVVPAAPPAEVPVPPAVASPVAGAPA